MARFFLVVVFVLYYTILGATSWAQDDGAETLERFQALPYVPMQRIPVIDFLPYGGDWSVEATEDGNVLSAPAGSGYRLEYQKSEPTSDFRISAEIFLDPGKSGNAALVTHVRNSGVGADAFDGYEFALYADSQCVMIGRHEQNFKELCRVAWVIPQNEWIAVEVCCRKVPEGNTLAFWVNGKKVAEILDKTPLAPGKIGFRPWQRTAKYRKLVINGNAIPLRNSVEEETASWPSSLACNDLPKILVVCRSRTTRPFAVGLDFWQPQPFFPGCALKIIDTKLPKAPIQTIFSDPDGFIYDAEVSYDAQTVYFSYRKCSEKYLHLYKINVDGTGLTQLTYGDFYDFSPCPLPSGEIAFVSTRHYGHTVCQPGPASNLYKMRADGSNIHRISMNTLSDFHPHVLPDGRILFTRWEYIDRDLTYRQSLWTQNPDGTGYQLYFGNTVRDCGSFLQSRPLPGRSDCVLSVFGPHHGNPHGAIGMIYRNHGPEAARNVGYEYITKDITTVGDRSSDGAYRDPYPLSETQFLCSFGRHVAENDVRFGVYLLNRDGEKRLLYESLDPKMGAFHPIPLCAQPMPTEIPSQNDAFLKRDGKIGDNLATKQVGTLMLTDVYEGLEPFVKRGEVAKIRIMEQVRKSVDLHNRAYDQSPVISYGTYYAKRCWGEVPVEADGSAYFEVPALREIYLQVLDKEGRELQRMTSALQVVPGQRQSCIGCHENRQMSPPSVVGTAIPQAAMRAPSVPKYPEWWNEIKPQYEGADRRNVDYVTLVQPVLDRHCVSCHSGKDPAGGYDLTGDKTRYFSMSYDNILGRSRSYRQHNMSTGRLLDQEAKKEKPLVHFYWLLWTPTGVNQPLESGTLASRLGEYLTNEHCQKKAGDVPISEADRQKIYLWIDANVPYYSTFNVSRPDTHGKRDLWETGDWYGDFHEVYSRRCQMCHGNIYESHGTEDIAQPTTNWTGRFAWINLTTPENSPALTAHLPKPIGRGIKAEGVFTSESDADYRKMLHAIQRGHDAMLANPRADMPGFRFMKKEF